ncbi:hypothetical protein [Bifidobacterium moukalabense]|uniref:Carbon starvation protein n=1 Tax=Bifidobacterium moukalabense DSM 27321 TaxID=1435051 RepID=W4NCT0_9BIFI|nr:hypothetical protein [Bifidobacterium moukalabense]ETY72296.1 carbon starvation protein [Bifidobacterium moukalabense DSM 27321]
MKLTTSGRARLYAITSVACIIWLVQSVIEANADGTLFSYATIILSLCLAFVSGYCAFNAIRYWNVKDKESRHEAE